MAAACNAAFTAPALPMANVPTGTPASEVAAFTTRAEYGDAAALKAFAAAVDVVTLEWENVDREAVRQLASHVPVHPGARSLEVAQDRMAEKQFVEWLGAPG